jgi:hypothetical protein
MNIYLILSIILSILICVKAFILNFQNKLTGKTKELMIRLCYNCIYIYSLCNIKFNIIKNTMNRPFMLLWSYLKENKILTEKIINTIVLIDANGNEINKIVTNNVELIELACKKNNYSGLFLMDKNVDTECVNNVFYTSFPRTFDYNISKISFISIELEHENKIYSINLKNNKYNYYIINNCLNQTLFKYYIKNIIKSSINETKFDYKVTIIDNNVNIITLFPNQYLLIREDDYQIHF